MNLYSDTNVYDFVAKSGETEQVRTFLDVSGHRLRVSADNVYEFFAVSDPQRRDRLLRTLTYLGSVFEERPQSWLHAEELRREIGCWRRHWLRTPMRTKSIQSYLRGHLNTWRRAKSLQLGPANAYAVFRRDFDTGVAASDSLQKAAKVLIKSKRPISTEAVFDNDPETFWRKECLESWFNAIATGSPASRDYADWLGPYLKDGAFLDPTYRRFWLEEVRAEKVPRNRLTGLIGYYQIRHKVTPGNSLDRIHANNIFDVDRFLTADRIFHLILTKVIENHFPQLPRPLLIDRNRSSALEAIKEALAV